ncbi:MAG: type IV secretory system conjugative DNA transfer family protein [Candidatus Accumulibacter sp.]|nr:type IV secretory system conjugative DNA transfer family protein [Accumulibacter sp.]
MSTALKAGIGVLVFLVATLLAVYLAGFFVLMANKANPALADLTTFYRAWDELHEAAEHRKRLNVSAILAAALAYGLPLLILAGISRNTRALHGAARFAKASEVEKSGLLGTKGIIVGRWKSRYLMLPGQQFVLLAAPTRSGKGVGIVIPNLLHWPDSVVVLDVKQENYNATAGFRSRHGQKCHLFNPFAEDYRSARYNPLGYVRDGDYRVGDLIAIGEVFYPSGASRDAFFDDQARNLFVGLGLYVCETPALPRTIGEMLRQSSGKGLPIKDYLEDIIRKRNHVVDAQGNIVGERRWSPGDAGPPPLSMECVDALNRFISTSDNTRSSILASFNAPLGIWANPFVDCATSENDFDLRQVRKSRMSIYVGITPDHMQEAGRLVNLLFSQLVNLNTKTLPQDDPALKVQCLLLLDEFTAIGKVGIIAKAVSYMAGYNLRLLPIIQSLAQLSSVYGHEDARTFVTNHALQILFAPREQKDANEYSEMLGYETVKGKSTSRQVGGRATGGRNESESDQRRALLLPQEIKEIGPDKEIVLLENCKPILCDKIRYFDDKTFTARLLPPPPAPRLDMETHRARIQGRTRPMTLADVEQGIDLSRLALDASRLEIPEGEVTPGDVERIVDGFFAMLDESAPDEADEDGSCAAPSPDELAALEAMHGDDGEMLLDLSVLDAPPAVGDR